MISFFINNIRICTLYEHKSLFKKGEKKNVPVRNTLDNSQIWFFKKKYDKKKFDPHGWAFLSIDSCLRRCELLLCGCSLDLFWKISSILSMYIIEGWTLIANWKVKCTNISISSSSSVLIIAGERLNHLAFTS